MSDLPDLAWLPDESLFSLCGRIHSLSANYLASTTCRMLFGHPQRGSAHDFSSRIDSFVRSTEGRLGSSPEVILQHTLLPFYLPLSAPGSTEHAIEAMRGQGIGSLKFQLGLLTSRFRAHHPLKACPVCMGEDQKSFGVAYWHVTHQFPGVWVCTAHSEPLWQADQKATGVGRFLWCLPNPGHLIPGVRTEADRNHPKNNRYLKSLALNAVALATLSPKVFLAPELMATAYRLRLLELGFMKGKNQARLDRLRAGTAYTQVLRSLRVCNELEALPSDDAAAAKEIYRLAFRPVSNAHPLRHLSLITWLFNDFDAFMQAYKGAVNQQEPPPSSWPLSRAFSYKVAQCKSSGSSNDSPKKQRFQALLAEGFSVSASARRLSIDVSTGMHWAALAGQSTPSRASILCGYKRTLAISMLEAGISKQGVAEKVGVSIGTITKLLRTQVGLRDHWRSACLERAKQSARTRWLLVTSHNPESGVKSLRLLEPAAYAWLYRNDRGWLDSQVATLRAQPVQGGRQVNWDERDHALATFIEQIALELSEGGKKHVNLWEIYQRSPELHRMRGKLDRLPKTSQLIKQATQLGQ